MGRTLTTAALLLGLLSPAQPSHANSRVAPAAKPTVTADAPKSKAEICTLNPGKCAYMPQNDAFSTAGEQALFLAVYQKSFGPYGADMDPAKRNQLLKETSQAINDCLAGSNCGVKQQEMVLKALIQYNMGQDIKHMMLTNNTNAAKMHSIEDYSKDARGKIKADPKAMEKSLARGATFTYENAPENLARANRGESGQSRMKQQSTISRGAGIAKDPYYSLKEDEVSAQIDPAALKSQEIFGGNYLKDYGAITDHYARPSEAGRYKYVKPKETYIYDEANGKRTLDPNSRFEEIKQEQERFLKTGKPLADLKDSLAPVEFRTGADGVPEVNIGGLRRKATGIGEAQRVDTDAYAAAQKVNFDDLKNNPGLDETTRNARVITRVINTQIKTTAEEHLAKERAKANKSGRFMASAQPGGRPDSDTKVNVVLDPKEFDKFLDEIWPNSAARQARIQAP